MKSDHYLERSLMAGWQFLTGDVNFADYSGKWYRQIGDEVYHVIELVNMIDACGSDASYTYSVSLQEIDLSIVDIDAALSCCGWISDDCQDDTMIVDSVSCYGSYAPMGQYDGNNYRKLLADAKRESRLLTDDSAYHNAQLCRPVNRLGSTALEFSRGDFTSAMIRGIASGDKSARIIAKIHGANEEDIDTIAEDKSLQSFSLYGDCNG